MSYDRTKNIYDDGNIQDSDLPERAGASLGHNTTETNAKNGYVSHSQNGYHYNPGNHSDGSPAQPPLAWTTPPVLPSEADKTSSDALEML